MSDWLAEGGQAKVDRYNRVSLNLSYYIYSIRLSKVCWHGLWLAKQPPTGCISVVNRWKRLNSSEVWRNVEDVQGISRFEELRKILKKKLDEIDSSIIKEELWWRRARKIFLGWLVKSILELYLIFIYVLKYHLSIWFAK